MSECASGIYAITNTVNGKQYIGQSVNIALRWASHRNDLRSQRHRSWILQRAWNKYGAEAFAFSVLEYVEPGSDLRERLTEREQHWMDVRMSARGSREYNIAPAAGSMLGYRHSLQTREKMRLSAIRTGKGYRNKGHRHSAEAREKMRRWQLGKKPTEAQLAGLRIGQRRRGRTLWQLAALRESGLRRRGQPPSGRQLAYYERLRGQTWTPAHRAAYEANRDQPLSERQQAAYAARRGQPLTERQQTAYAARRGRTQPPESIAKREQTKLARGNHPSQRDFTTGKGRAWVEAIGAARDRARQARREQMAALAESARQTLHQPTLFD